MYAGEGETKREVVAAVVRDEVKAALHSSGKGKKVNTVVPLMYSFLILVTPD